MRRREFMALVVCGGVAIAARAQQPERVRRIGVLMPIARADLEAQKRIGAFVRPGKARLAGRKAIAFEMRYADGKPERLPALANELVQANVDVIVTHAAQPIEAVRKATSTIPIVMATVGDALGAG